MIELAIQQGVARVCLNRPQKRNAFDDVLIQEMTRTFKAINANPEVRVMVLEAAGEHFSAGADLDWMRRMASYSKEDNLRDARALAAMLKELYTLKVPTIARVQGAAFGGAVGLIACCDMAVGATEASFALSEVKIGLIPATISPYVIEAMGARAAQRFFLTGERFDASKALQLGLLHKIADAEQIDHAVDSLINHLLANSPAAVCGAKQLIRDVAQQPLTDELIEDTCERIAEIRVSSEGQEGLTAFLEKRSPRWVKKGG